jgi:hypothetical protein
MGRRRWGQKKCQKHYEFRRKSKTERASLNRSENALASKPFDPNTLYTNTDYIPETGCRVWRGFKSPYGSVNIRANGYLTTWIQHYLDSIGIHDEYTRRRCKTFGCINPEHHTWPSKKTPGGMT